MSFTVQVSSWAEWTPLIPVLCLGHSVGSGFLCRDDVLILSANPEKIVCRIGREATQIGCWGEQIPSEIVVLLPCGGPISVTRGESRRTVWRHTSLTRVFSTRPYAFSLCLVALSETDRGRGASEGYKAPISRAVYAPCMRCSMQSFGLALMCVTLRVYNRAGIMDGAPYVYRKCIWQSCLAC